jgi:hypothetical protein
MNREGCGIAIFVKNSIATGMNMKNGGGEREERECEELGIKY